MSLWPETSFTTKAFSVAFWRACGWVGNVIGISGFILSSGWTNDGRTAPTSPKWRALGLGRWLRRPSWKKSGSCWIRYCKFEDWLQCVCCIHETVEDSLYSLLVLDLPPLSDSDITIAGKIELWAVFERLVGCRFLSLNSWCMSGSPVCSFFDEPRELSRPPFQIEPENM